MKKLCIFLFMIFAMWQFQGVYAQSYNVSDTVKEVSIGYSSQYLNKRDIYRGYTTTNKNEITMITHYLESLKQTEGGGAPSDSRVVSISLKYDSGNVRRFDIYGICLSIIGDTKQSFYKFPITEYYRMCDFINSLILNKFDNSTMVSIEPSSWAKEYVDEAIISDLIPKWNQIGYTTDIPRVEVCQLIDNLLTVTGTEKELLTDYTYLKDYPFTDTKDISAKELYMKGIINGKSETEFCPYDYITREEFAKILSNTYNCITSEEVYIASKAKYSDSNDISDWAADSVKTVTALSLMQGDENGNFNPKGNITKEQVIVTLLRLYNLI